MKLIALAILALTLTGCGTIKSQIHQWTAPEVVAPVVDGKGAGGGGAMRR